MSSDPSIWIHTPPPTSRLRSHQQPVNSLALDAEDPTKIWIEFLMDHGAYFTLLGLPALFAIASFLRRIRWLLRNGKPHGFGRTGFIYWPTQIFICLASLVLVVLILTSLISKTWESTLIPNMQDGLIPAALLTLMALGIVSLGSTRPLTPEDLENTVPPWLKTKLNYDLVAEQWERAEKKIRQDDKESAVAAGKKTPKRGANKKDKNRNAFFWAVLKAYRRKIINMLLVRTIGFAFLYCPPVLFGQLLRFIDDYSSAVREGVTPPALKIGLMIASAMFFFNVASTTTLCVAFHANTDLGIEARAATVALIYRKALRLSPAARVKSTLGEITNHMAVDAERWFEASIFLPLLITIPFELIISICLLYRLLGWSLTAGFGVFVILVPIQVKSADFMNNYQEEMLKWMDHRLRLMTEILSNIKIVKLYNWEVPFRHKVDNLRTKELKALKGLATIRSILTMVFSSVTLLMALCTFSVYATVGGPGMTPGKMTSEVIFVSITLFGIMNRPLGLIAHMISKIIGIVVATQRIQKYLLLEEIDNTVVQRYSRQDRSTSLGDAPLAIKIKDGTFAWEQGEVSETVVETEAPSERQPLLGSEQSPKRLAKPVLSDINLTIQESQITAIVGRIGQGKSSLFSAIMGETYKQKGSVTVWGSLAYVPQQAWITNATVRDNILFGKPFDQARYDHIIYASGLKPDLEMLSAGDQTEIGERGINLSGGQKQRVSLARAAYQDADIYLLDDPLSAVDAHVDQHLWLNLIGPEGLLKDKTRILVTHGIHHLEHVDHIVVLKDGRISETGEYQHLMQARGLLYQLIKEFSVSRKKKKRILTSGSSKPSLKDTLQRQLVEAGAIEYVKGYGATTTADTEGSSSTTVNASKASSVLSSAAVSELDDQEEISEQNTIVEDVLKADPGAIGHDKDNDAGELIADEKMEEGKVGWRVLMIYAKAADTQRREQDGEEGRPVSYYLIGYGRLILMYVLLDVLSDYTTEVVCGIRASKVLHDNLLTRVFRLPMSFFDTTPMGRIVNRFSSDINAIDVTLPEEWNDLFAFTAIITGTLFVIAYSTPMFLVMIPPLVLVYFWIQDYFIKVAQSLKRMYSVSKSPLFQHFSETLSGASSIRAMDGLQDRFVLMNDERADSLVNRFNALNLNNRWLQMRLEILGAFTVFSAASLAVLNAEKMDPSMVGLALSYALNMIGYANYLIRTVCEVANILVSVERVDEYSNKPTEAPVTTGVHLPEKWPQHGQVIFKNYSTRYRQGLDLVIKDVSFTVQPMQKIGIVGRTGAGKSSLTLALFRIVEAADSYWARASDPSSEGIKDQEAKDRVAELLFTNGGEDGGGSIEIDGIDISTLGLSDLRQHLSIIPQDPTLFAGTVRRNLDPFEEQTDQELWEALERAHLKDHIASLPGGLSFEVAQNGDNFSVGQRSLICLARALLRKTKVLILDEATAAVDVETDDLIQKTIRKEFQDRTILTIAHRIKTVMDSDKILVLEKGRVQEYDSPKELLKKRESLFYRLAEQAGEIEDSQHPPGVMSP
ncbi:hypothetical protein BGZ83_002894 [Gryganskiella cystojenkinii]|nr:hypothetical protein BGZ83_002894 [Gryganskiella cystojenkinii]